ncbi:hypothetical protein K461DRAFT_278490 [Myriangium duriaei CBS 260.36]|uniref:Rhodopsin domain-containing protein n=1 Tax=Myriangium duriaei CBS 260.36 TaxID=1168546 RepID=A0A9P4MFE3_9PEZI|nr:hypothetical protein K461DRAFT_278490 [Myriangium duriaei CBS 260.36]
MVDGIFSGGGIHVHQIEILIKVGTTVYIAAMALLKISLGAFFLRIFSIQKVQRHTIYAVVIVTILYSIVYGVITAATCGATSGFFGVATSCKVAAAYSGITTSWCIMNAVGDLIFSALSVDALSRAQMRPSTRFWAALVLLLGTVGGIASVVRISIILHNAGSGDLQGVTSGLWTILETSIGITAANLACLRPLLRLARAKIQSKRSHSYSSSRHPTTIGNHYMHSSPPKTDDLYMLSSALHHKTNFVPVKDWTKDRIAPEQEVNASFDDLIDRTSAKRDSEDDGQSVQPTIPQSPALAATKDRPSSSLRVLSSESIARFSRISAMFKPSAAPSE